jgi:hypothetical protein
MVLVSWYVHVLSIFWLSKELDFRDLRHVVLNIRKISKLLGYFFFFFSPDFSLFLCHSTICFIFPLDMRGNVLKFQEEFSRYVGLIFKDSNTSTR